jgi:hypothetical protein
MQWGREAPVDPAYLVAGIKEGGNDIDTPSEIPATKGVAGALGANEPAESEAMDNRSDRDTLSRAEDISIEGMVTDPPQT